MDTNHRRRVIAAGAAVASALAVAAACTHHWPPPPRTTTTPPSSTSPSSTGPSSTSPSSTTGTTVPRTTPPTVPGTADCGTINYASGWPTTRVIILTSGPGKCLLDAAAAGTPARLVTYEQTDGLGGHPVVTYYDVRGPGDIRVVTDRTQASPPGPVEARDCTGVEVTGFPQHLQPTGCAPA